MPAQQNVEGAIASLNWLLNQAGVRADSLSPNDNDSSSSSTINGVDVIPISMTINSGDQELYRALSTIERSIRTFDVDTLTIERGGNSGSLNFSVKMNAYYSGKNTVEEKNQTVTTKGVK